MSSPYQKKMWPESETVSDNSHLQIDNTADLNREMEEVTEGHVEVDLIVRAAEQSFEGTTALVSLIDEANTLVAQKCCVRSEHMDIASGVFSSQTIREGGFTEVCDARGDRRFSGSPLVTAGPNIAYYAGVPLRLNDGSIPGVFAVISTTTRGPMTADDIALLERCAARVSRAVEACLDS